MVAISLYRGKLHGVSDASRQWPMPSRALTLDQFRILTRKRDEALARSAAAQRNPNSIETKRDERESKVKHANEEEDGELKNPEVSDPQPIQIEAESNRDGDCKMIDADADADANEKDSNADVKMEVSNNLDTDKEKKKIELEKRLEVLNQKKHHLVQILKQVLNAEEEIKRRNAQSAFLHTSIPLQAETAVDMGSATRHVPKLSVEVNFGGDLGVESDATANHSAHGRQMHHMHSTSPAAVSLTRSFQHNTFLPTPRPSLATSGQGQTPSNVLVGNTAAATSSPSRFVPTGYQGHHHSASLPPVSVPGSHFMASSPSPAASGGASSVFRD